MRQLLVIAAVLLGAAPTFAFDAQVHEKCLKASDYKGCVEALSGGVRVADSGIKQLKKALRRLPNRLENTNLEDFTANTQFFEDAIADIDDASLTGEYEAFVYSEARTISDMLDALQSAWSSRIYDGTYYGSYGYKSYRCKILSAGVRAFNASADFDARYTVPLNVTYGKADMFGFRSENCSPQEYLMIKDIGRRVDEALIDPEVRQAKIDKKQREEELCKLAPWERHLEENPGLKTWAAANPGPAQQQRDKFLKDPKNKSICAGSSFSSEKYSDGGFVQDLVPFE